MNILSSQQMRQIEAQLLKVTLPSNFQLNLSKLGPSRAVKTRNVSILQPASQNAILDIRKVVSLADNIRSSPTNDPDSGLKVFTMAVLAIIYKGRMGKVDNSPDNLLLDALKCSLFSPDVALNNIKNTPLIQNSNQMKAVMATFFDTLENHRTNQTSDVHKLAQLILQTNQQLLNCFIIFFRFILMALQVEGANIWKGTMNVHSCLQQLLDYFDLSHRIIGDLFLLYEQGVFLSVKEKEVVFGQYFQNEGEKLIQKQQIKVNSSIKLNMVDSYPLNVNQEEARKKKGIVDSDLKMFNFMLDSCQDQVKPHPDNQTPHFKENEAFHFGKKKKEETVAYRPEEVRFQFEKLIKDESLQEIQPDDLINFNAQFDDSPSLSAKQFNFAKHLNSPSSLDRFDHVNRVNSNSIHSNMVNAHKNKLSLLDHQTYVPSVLPRNQFKKGATEINENCNNVGMHNCHQKHNISNLHSCFCRQIRMSRNNLIAKVIDFSFVPILRKSPVSPLPPKTTSTKSHTKNPSESESYTLNKEMAEKKSEPQERTPSFLKNLKKQGPLKPNDSTSPHKEQFYPYSSQQISSKAQNAAKQQENQRKSPFMSISNPRFRQDGLMKMKVSDNQAASSKKIELYDTQDRGVMGQSNANWQKSSNFRQRHLISTSPLNHSKSTFMGSPQDKNTSPLKFFAPVQIIAPTVYVNSNGNETNSNIVFKLSELHQNSPKLIRGRQPPFANKFHQSNNQSANQFL